MRLPIGLSPGQSLRAIVSFTISTALVAPCGVPLWAAPPAPPEIAAQITGRCLTAPKAVGPGRRPSPFGGRHGKRLEEDEQADQAVDGRDDPQDARQQSEERLVARRRSGGFARVGADRPELGGYRGWVGTVGQLDRD